MLRVFHALTRAGRVALSISVLFSAVASTGFLSGCSDQSDQQASSSPEGPAEEVLRDADESTWMQALRAGTLGAFTDYLQNFPNGRHAAEARERIAALEAQARKGADERAWAAARQADTAASYADYLRDFPQGGHVAEARERQAALDQQAGREADEKAWQEALRLGTQVSFRDYLRQFPNGAHAAEARRRLAALEQQARKEADENAWEEALRIGSLAALQDYLRNFPNGAHAADARQRIAALNAGPSGEAQPGTSSERNTAARNGRPKRAQSGTQMVHQPAPSANPNVWLRPFWQSLFPVPSK